MRYWWLKIPDPRIVSVVVGSVYGAAFLLLGGIGTLVSPPPKIVEAVPQGETAMIGLGVIFTLGALVGMVGGTLDHWQLERVGVVAMLAGSLLYAYIEVALSILYPGTRFAQLGMLGAGVGFLALRLTMIWRYDYKPRGMPHDAD